MCVDSLLYLDRRDVLSAGDDHALGTIAKLDVTIRMDNAQVATAEPTIAGGGERRFVVVVVAQHHVVSTHLDFADSLAVMRNLVPVRPYLIGSLTRRRKHAPARGHRHRAAERTLPASPGLGRHTVLLRDDRTRPGRGIGPRRTDHTGRPGRRRL